MTVSVLTGDCVETMREMEAGSVQTCVTSPPYFGLRDYGHEGQIGLEDTPDAYVARLVEVFREVRRLLRDDGTLWLNLGDSYAGSGRGVNPEAGTKQGTNKGSQSVGVLYGLEKDKADAERARIKSQNAALATAGLKPKDLIGIPWRVAFALQADGWYLRQDIIWHKPNPMPESVRDRCTKAHEYIFLLSKGPRYYFDADAVREPLKPGADHDRKRGHTTGGLGQSSKGGVRLRKDGSPVREKSHVMVSNPLGRNRRSVWDVPTQPFPGAHFATFPPELIRPCILAGAPRGGMVLDPFGGSGTTGMVAAQEQRRAILCELNPAYAAMARERITSAGLFAWEGAAE